jgi:hypothetical protein
MSDQPFWTRSPAEAASALGRGFAGLTSAKAILRLHKYGRDAVAQVREAGLIVSSRPQAARARPGPDSLSTSCRRRQAMRRALGLS